LDFYHKIKISEGRLEIVELAFLIESGELKRLLDKSNELLAIFIANKIKAKKD